MSKGVLTVVQASCSALLDVMELVLLLASKYLFLAGGAMFGCCPVLRCAFCSLLSCPVFCRAVSCWPVDEP